MSDLDRTVPEMLALAAWLNVPVDKIPQENRAHVDEYTMQAWRRVSDAIAEYTTLHTADRIEALEAENARLRKTLQITRDKLHSQIHDQFDGIWTDDDFARELHEADAALANAKSPPRD